MTTRQSAPLGAPCWADLWTSDVEGSRQFYAQLFGWEALEPAPEFGGYFMFAREGVPVAGGMGDMGEMKANNTWKVYLATEDIEKTVATAEAEGATVLAPPMTVGDSGVQTVLVDPTGATVGLWQALQFPGFTVLAEAGAPNWFELVSHDYQRSINFYRAVFNLEADTASDTDQLRYTMLKGPDGQPLFGIMDGTCFGHTTSSWWSTYWQVDDMGATVAAVDKLGGQVTQGPDQTPWGILATASDPAGASFKLLAHAS